MPPAATADLRANRLRDRCLTIPALLAAARRYTLTLPTTYPYHARFTDVRQRLQQLTLAA